MKLSDFSYHLPKTHIAKKPLVPRDTSKLLVIDKNSGEMQDDHYYNLADHLQSGDILVRNNTKVIPARLFGTKDTGGKIEVLLVKKHAQSTMHAEVWECLTKPGIRPGQKITFSPTPTNNSTTTLTAVSVADQKKESTYTRLLSFNLIGESFNTELKKIGSTPLPPYIADETSDSADIQSQYQTVYAKYEGSVAAPTAGLHFTPELEKKILAKGVLIVEVTLHVGLGTFLPVKSDNILEHHMHGEWFEITEEAATSITQAKKSGKRIVAVGTTSARLLESVSKETPSGIEVLSGTGETSIYIHPGYKYKCVDGLLTNFHLPESTLLMLVSALVTQPNTDATFTTFLESNVGKAYVYAIAHDYRFYSFGDGMLII